MGASIYTHLLLVFFARRFSLLRDNSPTSLPRLQLNIVYAMWEHGAQTRRDENIDICDSVAFHEFADRAAVAHRLGNAQRWALLSLRHHMTHNNSKQKTFKRNASFSDAEPESITKPDNKRRTHSISAYSWLTIMLLCALFFRIYFLHSPEWHNRLFAKTKVFQFTLLPKHRRNHTAHCCQTYENGDFFFIAHARSPRLSIVFCISSHLSNSLSSVSLSTH